MRTPLYDRHEHACALALSPFRASILPELLRLKMSRIGSLSRSPQKRGVAAELMVGGHREGRTMVMKKLRNYLILIARLGTVSSSSFRGAAEERLVDDSMVKEYVSSMQLSSQAVSQAWIRTTTSSS